MPKVSNNQEEHDYSEESVTEPTSPPSSPQSDNPPAVIVEDSLADPNAAESTHGGIAVGDDAAVDVAYNSAPAEGDAPAVVAIVVATNPGDGFAETLASLAAQDYANFSVLVVDAADGDPIAEQVAGVIPDAYIHRVTGAPGFSAAANQAMTLISGAAFLLICHDDVALDARCTSTLVEELYRSNAGIVTPKVVQWEDRRRLQQIGRSSDRFGVQIDLVEPDEFDQEQYDSVRDVFVAPSGVQLIRADLFTALKGFDPVIHSLGEDLDLCWRAHLAGARVMTVPAARARHLNEHSELGSIDDRRQSLGRHRLRTLLVVSGRYSALTHVPAALLLLLLEAAYALLSGHRPQARAAIGAISWNAARLDEIRERRRAVQATRKVSDREIHALQVGGSARVSQYFRKQFGTRQDRLSNMVGTVRESLANQDSTVDRDGMVIAAILMVVLFFGGRNLVAGGFVPVGQIPLLPDAGTLLSEWLGGWRSAGLGGPGNAPTALVVLGLMRALFFWSPGLLNWLLLFGPVLLGGLGMWRLLRPFDSLRASSLATLAYVFNPVMVAAMSSGRWDALILFAGAPTLVGSILKIQGLAPYGSTGGPSGPGVTRRDLPTRLLRLGLLVTLLATFVPASIPVAVAAVAAVAIGSLLIVRTAGMQRLVLGAGVVIFVPVVLHMPWTVDVMARLSWEWLVGPSSAGSQFDSLADLMRFSPSGDSSVLVLGLLVAAAVSLVIGRGRRFDVGVIGWTLAAVSWFGLWTERRGVLPFQLPAPELVLVMAAVGLALAVGVGARSVEIDLRTHRFGWRQVTVLAGVVGLVAVSLLGMSASLGGRWGLPTHDYGSFTAELESRHEGPTRVLWLAHPAVAPLDTEQSPGGVHFAITDGAQPNVLNRWIPSSYGATSEIANRLDLAARGETVRLGRLLSLYGIDFVVVVNQLAPAPYEGQVFHPDDKPAQGVVLALQSQLDLERLTGIPSLVVYQNGASAGPAVANVDLAGVSSLLTDQLAVDLAASTRVDLEVQSSGRWSGPIIDAERLWIAVDGRGWTSSDGNKVSVTEGGMLMVEPTTGSNIDSVDLQYGDSGYRRIALVLQAVLLVLAFLLAQTRSGDAA